MPASFQEILNSRLFKFIVGEKVDGHAQEFFVHEEAITQLSKPLEALMRGGMTESQAGCTVWDDVSKETFERFVQFAYTGDYSVPVPVFLLRERVRSEPVEPLTWASRIKMTESKKIVTERRSAIPSPEPTTPEPAESGVIVLDPVSLNWGSQCIKNAEWRPRREKLSLTARRARYSDLTSVKFAADFRNLTFPLLAKRNNHDHTCEPNDFFNPNESYSNVFIGHAALYILGDFRLIEPLKALALYKLHKILCIFELSDENMEDVINLARYVYAEEGGGEGSSGEIGALRSLVCHYMAMHAFVLSVDDGFMEFLGEGGQFVKDFFKFEVQRVG
ncbi:hypothetical protein BCIN_01g10410 [Botrytis cinerea B05.10]|uniref:BTB domain-containing protein n=2 Tax=Botryotinia fuckeliana TaxID=40559 RepID=A0A384J7D6_BOTFB|nr:hypothetical protein BCIN_01g10410 [Botrytis cinerea B05.10]ATZ46449.1 hypothetical protein BCIN_01g10410 [Botrytis cinerea B05.10]EMR86300.1 hypothetical protein BcDW1_5111 [Botrytis cinerea BcDW1]